MPQGVRDIVDAVKQVGMSDPMAQIGDAMGRAGKAIQDTAASAKKAATEAYEKAKSYVTATPQGTTKGTVSKEDTRKKRLKKVRVEPTANGGFVVSHHYKPGYGGTPKPDRHAFADYDTMHEHLETLKGDE